MISDVVLEVSAEGGSILLRANTVGDLQQFWVQTDEAATYDMLSKEDQEGLSPGSRSGLVSSFDEGLGLLDRYEWFRLSPISLDPRYVAAILAAVRTRVEMNRDDESPAILDRWSVAAGELIPPLDPARISDASLISGLVRENRDDPWVKYRVENVERDEIDVPSKEAFWKQLVLTLLTSQQRSTKGSAVDAFEQKEQFPLELGLYENKTRDEILRDLAHFRFGKRVTDFLQANHDVLFGSKEKWGEVLVAMKGLVQQWTKNPQSDCRFLEREAAHFLDDLLWGIGPKQARNLLQELGLTRYEIPLDSRVIGWLGENLGWNASLSDLASPEGYEFWLDRVQSVCREAGVLPAIFDAAAFGVGSSADSRQSLTARTGYVNANGQVVVRNTRGPGSDRTLWVYQLGCSHCGREYGEMASDIKTRRCPSCQGGSEGVEL